MIENVALFMLRMQLGDQAKITVITVTKKLGSLQQGIMHWKTITSNTLCKFISIIISRR